MKGGWHPASWRERPAAQMPVYADAAALAEVEHRLGHAEPVVKLEDIGKLKDRLAGCASGRGLLLQGGDCAETFDEPDVEALVALFEHLAGPLEHSIGVPVTCVARIAGQFAKPRTVTEENGRPVWRGEIVNGRDAPEPDARRMVRAHRHAAQTAARLPSGLFASHEALLLPYEQALLRVDADGRTWGGSGHMLWVGERTRQVDGAHVEFLSGIANPIGVKCGPALQAEELLRLCDRLDPRNEPGRLTLIVRQGAEEIARALPPLMRAVRSVGRQPLWVSDPMHGNTLRGGTRKRRLMPDMAAEVRRFVSIAEAEGAWAGGMHLEMTPEIVEECGEVPGRWTSACDPRLNPEQAAELVAAFASAISRRAAA